MQLAEAIARLYALRVDTTTRDGDGSPHEKPHKPLLLLAALDLIDEGLASPDRIPWCQALRDPASRATPGQAGFRLYPRRNHFSAFIIVAESAPNKEKVDVVLPPAF